MLCLVIADRSPNLDFVSFVRDNKIDLIITLGDLSYGDLAGLENIKDIPKIGVYGNHDSGTYMPSLGVINLHMATWEYGGLKFGGFQGCVRYKENPDAVMYTQEEASRMFAVFPPVDVMIAHCPPRGINDEDEIAHQGFDGLRKYLDTHHPKVLVHGHTYPSENELVREYNGTRIEYVYRYRVVEI